MKQYADSIKGYKGGRIKRYAKLHEKNGYEVTGIEIKPVADMSYEELLQVSTIFGVEIHQMCSLTKAVWHWFDDKGLSDPIMQFVKMEEECGELAHELTRGRTDSFEVVDSLGDILVTVIGLCHHLHIPPEAALSLAYDQIKDRKGNVVNGSFVKDETLQDWEKMQRGEFKCACCSSYLFPVDDTHVECRTCGLKFRLKDGKIQVKGNNMEDYE